LHDELSVSSRRFFGHMNSFRKLESSSRWVIVAMQS
jgi:hypothetical protein